MLCKFTVVIDDDGLTLFPLIIFWLGSRLSILSFILLNTHHIGGIITDWWEIKIIFSIKISIIWMVGWYEKLGLFMWITVEFYFFLLITVIFFIIFGNLWISTDQTVEKHLTNGFFGRESFFPMNETFTKGVVDVDMHQIIALNFIQRQLNILQWFKINYFCHDFYGVHRHSKISWHL